MKGLPKILALTGAVLAVTGGPAYGNDGPAGLCPVRNVALSLVDIADIAAYEDFHFSKWASPLAAVDRNQDGFACLVLRCTPCPAQPPMCHTFCMFSGPLADNDVIPE